MMLSRQACSRSLAPAASILLLTTCVAYRRGEQIDDGGSSGQVDARLDAQDEYELQNNVSVDREVYGDLKGQLEAHVERADEALYGRSGRTDYEKSLMRMDAPLTSECPAVGRGEAVEHSDSVRMTRGRDANDDEYGAFPLLPGNQLAGIKGLPQLYGAVLNDPELNEAVLNADEQFFSTFIDEKSETVWLVIFYTPWCGPCKRLAPKWLKLGLLLRNAASKVQLVGVNCQKKGQEQRVTERICGERKGSGSGYPAIKAFYTGSNADVVAAFKKLRDYREERAADVWKVEGAFLTQNMADGAQKMKLFFEALASERLGYVNVEAATWATNTLTKVASCPPTREFSDVEWLSKGWPTTGWPPEPTKARRFNDAAFAAMLTLRFLVKPKRRVGKDITAFFERDGETDISRVRSWVELLSTNFPPWFNSGQVTLVQLFADLHGRLQAATGEVCIDEWQRWLEPLMGASQEAFPEPLACNTLTCLVWTMFHVLSIAPAVGHSTAMSAEETATRIMDFARNWLFQGQAIPQWDVGSGAYDKAASITDANLMPIWLWRIHNAVSDRVVAEEGCPDVDRRWPPIDVCPDCWEEGEEWDVLLESKRLWPHSATAAPYKKPATPNEVNVLEYLKAQFWVA